MEEFRYLELQRSNVIIALNKTHYLFHKFALKAIGVGLYISAEMKVCGDAGILVKNNDIVKRVEEFGKKTLSLCDELANIDKRLDELYRAKFEELKSKYAENPFLRQEIPFYEQYFAISLSGRFAGDLLERMEMRL